MCRFAAYLGPPIRMSELLTEPSQSIIHQSYRAREWREPLNGDGFGVGWYVPHRDEPVVFREVSPAWSSVNLRNFAEALYTDCLLAHVRAATPGLPVHQLNCHPFRWGPLSFMHNGELGGFPVLRRKILQQLSMDSFNWVKGSTDTEHVFAMYLDRFRAFSEVDPEASRLDLMARAMRTTIADIEGLRLEAGLDELSQLNLVVCDGKRIVVSRYVSDPGTPPNTLYVHHGGRYEVDDGVCHMRPAPTPEERAVIVASEPLSEGPGWRAVPVGHLVLVDENRDVHIEAI